MSFHDRGAAGRALGEHLRHLHGQPPVVLGLPRGGVVVGAEVARTLGAPLDLIAVRKLRTPAAPALAIGAIAEDDVQEMNSALLEEAGLAGDDLEQLVRTQRLQLHEELQRYRAVRPAVPLKGRTAVVVDDGMTTGSTAWAAARVAAGRAAARVTVAVPVSSREAVQTVARQVDAVVCLHTPPLLLALDEWYEDFPEVPDQDVIALLSQAAQQG
jgi:putative phosphoribosyl transferase